MQFQLKWWWLYIIGESVKDLEKATAELFFLIDFGRRIISNLTVLRAGNIDELFAGIE